jgi:hypothetical protein
VLAADEAGSADGRDEDVGLARDGRQVACARVADGDGRVGVQEEFGHGVADDVAAADHARARPADGDALTHEQLHDAGRGARDERRPAQREAADVSGVEAVHVLRRVD